MSTAGTTAKQRRFIDEYLVDGNGARSAAAAGYGRAGAAVAAHRLLSNANVRRTLQSRQSIDAARLGIDRQQLVTGLLEAVKMGRQRGEPTVMISALREIGRLMGFYSPTEIQDLLSQGRKLQLVQKMNALSDAELLALIVNNGASH